MAMRAAPAINCRDDSIVNLITFPARPPVRPSNSCWDSISNRFEPAMESSCRREEQVDSPPSGMLSAVSVDRDARSIPVDECQHQLPLRPTLHHPPNISVNHNRTVRPSTRRSLQNDPSQIITIEGKTTAATTTN